MGGSKGNTKFDGIRWDKHFQMFVADRNFNGLTVCFTFDTNQIRSDEFAGKSYADSQSHLDDAQFMVQEISRFFRR
ncbi:hypothetical protein FHS27_006567 [Rhodopirellula rubra]|uniref:Uncharacterized protein n=1 Tax=Aporhodopirellula rubra TaxID=980271 RepID=A0A7W5E5Q9_9BACT|nr:hypothetical protein [Aporhodopirellula rubra]MBB3210719.1 hypothetical protein [Aporhodopirellula rubra]